MRISSSLATTAAALLLLPAAAHASPCAGADVPVSAADLPGARHALLCLHNAERARRGLPPLHASAKLDRAGQTRVGEMVRRHYFDHTSPSGTPFEARVAATGYGRNARTYSLAENLGQGDGATTPADLVRAWLKSSEHRRALLGSYRDIGIGVASGTPSEPAAGMTVAVEFGRRRSK